MNDEIEMTAPEAPAEAPKRRGRPPGSGKKQLAAKRKAARVAKIAVAETEQAVQAPTRPELRPSMRGDDPRESAARRAAEIFDHLGGITDATTNEFEAPRAPDGWTYEWKRASLVNQPDTQHQMALRQTGWQAVPAHRHPDMVPIGWSGEAIERKGMLLMERPSVVTDKFRLNERRRASQQVRDKEASLGETPSGTLPRAEDSRTRPQIGKSFEKIEIPD